MRALILRTAQEVCGEGRGGAFGLGSAAVIVEDISDSGECNGKQLLQLKMRSSEAGCVSQHV